MKHRLPVSTFLAAALASAAPGAAQGPDFEKAQIRTERVATRAGTRTSAKPAR